MWARRQWRRETDPPHPMRKEGGLLILFDAGFEAGVQGPGLPRTLRYMWRSAQGHCKCCPWHFPPNEAWLKQVPRLHINQAFTHIKKQPKHLFCLCSFMMPATKFLSLTPYAVSMGQTHCWKSLLSRKVLQSPALPTKPIFVPYCSLPCNDHWLYDPKNVFQEKDEVGCDKLCEAFLEVINQFGVCKKKQGAVIMGW